MNIQNDFEEFLRLLVKHKVKFVLVGGYAVAFHGYVRTTKDMDIFFCDSDDNIEKIINTLRDFSINTDNTLKKELQEPGSIIRMGIPPVMIEMINRLSGISFSEVWEHRIAGKYGDISVNYISYKNLLINKKAAGRPKDLADVDELGGNRPPTFNI